MNSRTDQAPGDVAGRPGQADEQDEARSCLDAGILLARQGKLEEALVLLARGRTADPFQANVQGAHALCDRGQFERAAPYVAAALTLRPDSPTALYLDGILHEQRGDLAGARARYLGAIGLRDDFAIVHARLGRVLQREGDLGGARRFFESAIQHDPSQVHAWVSLGQLLSTDGDVHGAIACYRRGLEQVVEAAGRGLLYFSLGNAWASLGWHETALGAYRNAIDSGWDRAETWFNLGNSARELGDLDEARAAFERTLELAPEFAHAAGNLGVVLEALGEPERALRCYHQALAQEPENAQLHWNRALAYLATGRLRRGWEDYAWGYRAGTRERRELPWPVWDGSSLAGRCIVVHAESDLAGQLFFGTCLPDVIRQAGSCIVECDSRLVKLFGESLKGATVVGKHMLAETLAGQHVDCQASVAALPAVLRTAEASFPHTRGYLRPSTARCGQWRTRLAGLGPGLKVGVCVEGSSARSSLPRASPLVEMDLAPLFELAGVKLISLDHREAGSRAPDKSPWAARLGDFLPGDPLDALLEYAALLRVLDFVVVVDSVTAHLAGAVGARAIVLTPLTADWRWLRDRPDTPWYPTVQLVRQARSGDWDSAVGQVRSVLAAAADALNEGLELPDRLVSVNDAAKSRESAATLESDPELMALFERAVNNQRLGLLEEAGAAYRQLVRTVQGNADIWNNFGGVLQQLGHGDEAEDSLRRAAQLTPDNPEVLFNLASLLHQRKQPEEAAQVLERALALREDFLKAHVLLANIYQAEQKLDRAARRMQAALDLEPDNISVRIEYARLLHQQGPLAEAERQFERCLAIDPTSERALLGLSAVLADTERFDSARSYIDTVLTMRPDSQLAHSFMGRLHQVAGRLEEAVKWYTVAGTLDPADNAVKSNLGMVLLQRGDLRRGWELHEARTSTGAWTRRSLSWPVWDGSDLAGRTIFVYPEQGVGDEVMFASCYRDLQVSAGKLVLGCSDRLVPLFQRAFPSAVIIPRGVRANLTRLCAGDVELEIAAGSVPRYLRPDMESFGGGVSFLSADSELAAEFRARLRELGPGLRVGISWHGGGTAKARWQRSISLRQWAPLFRVPGVQWVSVQYGSHEQVEEVEKALGVRVHQFEDIDPLQDLERFAALLCGLDLVISVDNSTVHFGGALGVETWVLLPHVAEWRWFLDRSDSPWYGSLKLMRQPRPGKWEPVIKQASADLEQRVAMASGRESAL